MFEVGSYQAGRRKNCGVLQNHTQVNTSLEFEIIDDLLSSFNSKYNLLYILINMWKFH